MLNTTTTTTTNTIQEDNMSNSTRQPVEAVIIFLVPALLAFLIFGITCQVICYTWKKLNENREFRDTVLQLQTSAQNYLEAAKEKVTSLIEFR